MSAKHYKLAMPASSEKISKAKKALKAMPKLRKIDLMVKACVMTSEQAERAKQEVHETSNPSTSKATK
jgi:hypothetical protein